MRPIPQHTHNLYCEAQRVHTYGSKKNLAGAKAARPQQADLNARLCHFADGPEAVLIPARVSSSQAGTAALFRAASNFFARSPAEAGFWPVMRRPSTTT